MNGKITENQFSKISNLFAMFKEPTRLKILSILFKQACCVSDIVAFLKMEQSAVSHQLAILRKANLVKSEKKGKKVYYSLKDKHIETIFNMAYEHILESE